MGLKFSAEASTKATNLLRIMDALRSNNNSREGQRFTVRVYPALYDLGNLIAPDQMLVDHRFVLQEFSKNEDLLNSCSLNLFGGRVKINLAIFACSLVFCTKDIMRELFSGSGNDRAYLRWLVLHGIPKLRLTRFMDQDFIRSIMVRSIEVPAGSCSPLELAIAPNGIDIDGSYITDNPPGSDNSLIAWLSDTGFTKYGLFWTLTSNDLRNSDLSVAKNTTRDADDRREVSIKHQSSIRTYGQKLKPASSIFLHRRVMSEASISAVGHRRSAEPLSTVEDGVVISIPTDLYDGFCILFERSSEYSSKHFDVEMNTSNLSITCISDDRYHCVFVIPNPSQIFGEELFVRVRIKSGHSFINDVNSMRDMISLWRFCP